MAKEPEPIPALDRIFDIEVISRNRAERFGEDDFLPYMVRAFRIMEAIAKEISGDGYVEEEFERRMPLI